MANKKIPAGLSPEPDPSMEAELDPELAELVEHTSPDVESPTAGDRIKAVDLTDAERVKRLDGFVPLDPEQIRIDNERASLIGGVAAALQDQEQRKVAPARVEGDDPDWIYFVRCPDAGCRGPGVWIHTQPGGQLKPNDWEASYKPRVAAWPGTKLFCQVCYAAGRQTMLPVFHERGYPVLNERHVGKMSRAKFDELLTKAKS